MLTTDRDLVAWDIETTGFLVTDSITVSGFRFPESQYVLILNTQGNQIDSRLIQSGLKKTHLGDVSVRTVSNDVEMLGEMQSVLFEYFEREYNRLVAYNGDNWSGGFDLPFVRTTCAVNDIEWVFDGIEFADLYDIIEKRMNTTIDEGESNDLVGAHQALVQDESYTDSDPFEDSKEAVESWERGDFIDVAMHNLSDLRKTWELGQVADEYVSPRDWTTKKL